MGNMQSVHGIHERKHVASKIFTSLYIYMIVMTPFVISKTEKIKLRYGLLLRLNSSFF